MFPDRCLSLCLGCQRTIATTNDSTRSRSFSHDGVLPGRTIRHGSGIVKRSRSVDPTKCRSSTRTVQDDRSRTRSNLCSIEFHLVHSFESGPRIFSQSIECLRFSSRIDLVVVVVVVKDVLQSKQLFSSGTEWTVRSFRLVVDRTFTVLRQFESIVLHESLSFDFLFVFGFSGRRDSSSTEDKRNDGNSSSSGSTMDRCLEIFS